MTEITQLTGSKDTSASPHSSFRYNGFISYSHALDGGLAPALQQGLQRFAKPWYRTRALSIFRDNESLSASPHLWSSIQQALDDSEFFILLASPTAAGSQWVAREAERWSTTKPTENVLIALTDGDLVWDEVNGDFDWALTNALPRTLQGIFTEEPRYVDLRWAHESEDVSLSNPLFREVIADLAAPLRHKDKAEIASEEVRQHKRTVHVVWTAVLVMAALAIAATIVAVIAIHRNSELMAANNTQASQELAAQSLTILNESYNVEDSDAGRLGTLLAVESARISQTPIAREALTFALFPNLRPIFPVAPQNIAIDTKRNLIAVNYQANGYEYVGQWDLGTRRSIGAATQVPQYSNLSFNESGSTLAAGGTLLSTNTGKQIDQLFTSQPVTLTFAPLMENLIAIAPGKQPAREGSVQFWNTSTKRQVRSLTFPSHVNAIAFLPRSNILAVALQSGTVVFRDVHTGQGVLSPIHQQTAIEFISTSPQKGLVAIGDYSGTVTLWDAYSRQEIGSELSVPPGWDGTNDMAFSPDGKFLAAGDSAGDTVVWSVRLQEAAAYVLSTSAVAFSPKGNYIAIGIRKNLTSVSVGLLPSWYWEGSIDELSEKACFSARSNLSRNEWSDYVPDRPYAKLCSAFQ